ncbi:MAG: hypothetical protein LBP59_16425 [Planctomycetaceae bacterium]|jgi:hypothetical protein|nr:hypothetical protein [Planctomycetaceae bacterium]
MRLYSTANERGFTLKRLFVCLAAKCRRDARDPLVSPVFQDLRHFAWGSSGSQAKRLHHRIAGVSPACGCTQPLMSEVEIATAFLFAYRQSAGGTPAIRRSRLHPRIAGISSGSQARHPHSRIADVSPACGCTQPLMSEVKIATAFLFAYRQSAGGLLEVIFRILFCNLGWFLGGWRWGNLNLL